VFFFQAEDGIRDFHVTGVQTCALPICGSSYPHHVTIDMGAVRTITQFGVWRTTFENGGDDRAPDVIQFLVSEDNVTWVDLGEFDFNRFINGEQVYQMPEGTVGRYFKLVGVSGPQDSNFVLGEISAYGM